MNALAFILLRQSVLRRQSLAETRPSCDDAPPSKRLPDAGVTLIEMMVVLVIIGIVAALVVPNVIGRPDEARVAVAKADLRTVAASLEMYRLDNRTYPTTEQGLAALTAPPTSQPIPLNWVQGGYLPTPPVDPWGNSYLYKSPADNGPYELISNGADGVPGGDGADADIRHGPGIAGTGDGTANG
jgi:general secretion pathway protein G